MPDRIASAAKDRRFHFDLATPADNEDLLQFSTQTEMTGAIRFSFDRSPDYFAALRVEGRHTDVLVGRELETGRVVATGQRSVKNVFVNGTATAIGYLSGLRVGQSARSASFLSRGYARLNALQAEHPATFHLSTIMEDNAPARKVLLSQRLGLPAYHDLGRFCCVALSLHGKNHARSRFTLRRATAADAVSVVEFLNREGRTKQFFPEYRVEDFGSPGGLLPNLGWQDVFLAFDGPALLGTLAVWDQQIFRRWRVTGYAPWLCWSRHLLNLVARLRRMPLLPSPGSSLNAFNLALVCVRDNDRNVFKALLDEVIRVQQGRYECFLAGLHERDPLLPELLERPHVPLNSRLYLVNWADGNRAIQNLDGRIPYLELGSL
ncbi:MAG: hypothetical protein WCH99_15570 [Verrucomicrobiota bacterium]